MINKIFSQLSSYFLRDYSIVLPIVTLDDQLKKAKESFQTLYGDHQDAVMLLNKDGFLSGNQATLNLLGCIDLECFHLLHPCDLSPENQPCGTNSEQLFDHYIDEALLKGNLKFEWQFHHCCDKNKLFLTEIVFSTIHIGENIMLHAAIIDISMYKTINERLRRSEVALASVGDGIWDWNISTNLSIYSLRWKEMLGYLDNDILPSHQEWETRIHGDDQEMVAEAMQAYLTGKASTYRVEYRLKCKDDSYKWILGRGMVVSRDLQHQPLRMVGTHTDITQIKEAELLLQQAMTSAQQDIQKAQKRLKILSMALEQSHSSVNITDLDANIEYVNQAFVNSTGYSREEIIGQKSSLLRSDKTPLALFDAMWKDLLAGKTWQGEIINLDKHGKELNELAWVSPIRESDGSISHYLSVKEDITERKKTEAILTKLSMALEQSLSSVMITDLDANIEYVNQAFVNSTGYNREEVIGQKPSLFKSGKTTKATYDELWTSLLAGKSWQGEVINVNKQGEEFIELTWISPIRQDNGDITHYLGVKEDITSRKKNEALLWAAKEKAEKLAQTKSQFLANMSHEIRTPMTAIIGFSELALFDEMPTETRTYLQDINIAANHLLTILNDILDLSKLEAGCMSIIPAPFDVNDLLTSLHNLFLKAAQAKDLTLIFDIAPNMPDNLMGDSVRLRQVLINLLGNAIKFTKQGEVSLSITVQQLTATEAHLLFSIVDTGIGISAEQQDRLFQPFSQADDGFSRNYEGTGLGLVISQELMQLMDTSITLVSNPGLGSCFSFELTLPLVGLSIIASHVKLATVNSELLNNVHILVVEDDEFNKKLINKVLKQYGASTVLANNGLEALAALEQDSFDMVLMDLHMPSMNGYEATTEIRKISRYAQLPVIAFTASVTDEDKQRCKDIGMNDFIGKPLNKNDLLSTLAQWSNGSKNCRANFELI